MCEYTWIFCEGLLFIFGVRACKLANFSVCAGCYCLDMMLRVFSWRWRQWAGLGAHAWLLDPWQWQGPMGGWHRLLLVAGPWEEAVIRQAKLAPGVFGSGSSRSSASLGQWEQQMVLFLQCPLLCQPLRWLGPSGGGPWPPLESEITVVVFPNTYRPQENITSHLTHAGGTTTHRSLKRSYCP